MKQTLMQPVAVSVQDAANVLGLGLTKMKQLIAAEKIASIRVGRRVLVSLKALEAFAEAEQAGGE